MGRSFAIGTVGDVSDALRFLGRELTSTLRQCGLEVNWSGDIDRRIGGCDRGNQCWNMLGVVAEVRV